MHIIGTFYVPLHRKTKTTEMGRILAIDYGLKRTGLAVTDELHIIAHELTTVETPRLLSFLKDYCQKETVERFVVGEAKHLNNTPAESARIIEPFVHQLSTTFPSIPIARIDERFSSKMAFQSMIDSGMKKKQRQDKAAIDSISATIMLQDYMQQSQHTSK